MRVFQLCAGAASGGAETAFVDLTIALYQAGIDVTPICRPHPNLIEPLRTSGIKPLCFPFGNVFDFKTRRGLAKLIREQKPDIVQTWMNRAVRHAPRPSPNLPPFKLVARLGGYYNLKHYKGVDHFVTNTADIRRYLIAQGVDEHCTTHINNFADLGPVSAPVPRAAHDTPEDAFLFLTLARLHSVKGIDLFLEALATLPDTAYGWIAGDGPEREKLKAQAEVLGLSHRVRFLGWRDDRAALLKAADALVFPSRFEPFGNSFAQAWGAGCPLITSASEGPSQYVRHGEDALVVPLNDAVTLAGAMRRLMETPAMGESLAAAGEKRFAEEFTKQACVQSYIDLYRHLTIS